MITLVRKEQDPVADEIEMRLKSLVLAYETEIQPEAGAPYIDESGKKIVKKEELELWFRQLESELEWQRSLSGDGCFIDPETGSVC
jgi:hypothetical protein